MDHVIQSVFPYAVSPEASDCESMTSSSSCFRSRGLVGGLAEEKEMGGGGRGIVGSILRTVVAGVCEFARPGRVDSREVDVRVDGAECETETNQNQQNHQPNKHGGVTSHAYNKV